MSCCSLPESQIKAAHFWINCGHFDPVPQWQMHFTVLHVRPSGIWSVCSVLHGVLQQQRNKTWCGKWLRLLWKEWSKGSEAIALTQLFHRDLCIFQRKKKKKKAFIQPVWLLWISWFTGKLVKSVSAVKTWVRSLWFPTLFLTGVD